jgi:hypothetical protein
MTDQERLNEVEAAVEKQAHVNGVLTMALTTVLALANQEIANFKERGIVVIRQIRSFEPKAQAIIDPAALLFEGLEDV